MEHGMTTITGRVLDDHAGIVDVQGDMSAASRGRAHGRLRVGLRPAARRGSC